MPLTRRVCEAAAIAITLAILTVMAQRLSAAHGLLLADGQPVFGDFIVFWSAGRAALDGHAAELYDPAIITAYQNAAVPGMRFLGAWNSPPTFLLITAALASLPLPLAALTFFAFSSAVYLYAARKFLPDTRALIFAITMPAAFYHLGTVQVGLLIAGISGLALYWLDKKPRAAGAMIALLAIKPHLAILWPVYLAMSGRWRAFAAAAIGVSMFTLLAGLAFGFDSFLLFVDNLRAAQNLIEQQVISTPAYASLYGNLRGLGAPHEMAMIAHGASALGAIGLACWLFRRGDARAQGAALCAATLLISPYLFFYDMTLLGVGAAMLGAPRNRFEMAAFVFAWSAGLSLALGYFVTLPLCPLAAWLVLSAAARRSKRAESAALHSAPAPHT